MTQEAKYQQVLEFLKSKAKDFKPDEVKEDDGEDCDIYSRCGGNFDDAYALGQEDADQYQAKVIHELLIKIGE